MNPEISELGVPGSELAIGVTGLMFILFGVFFVAVLVFMAVGMTKRYRAAKQAGL